MATALSAIKPFNWRHTPGLLSFTAAIMVFLYAPLFVLIIYAFNSNHTVTIWQSFTFSWFVTAVTDASIQDATINSLIIAVAATIGSTIIAIAGALALERGHLRRGRTTVSAMIALPLIVPEIVVAITTLIFFSTLGMHHGLLNLIIAHTVFCIPFAILPIQARLRDMGTTLEEAGRDLYASELHLFRRITLPLLAPAIAAGAMMAFVVSLDDYLISQMLNTGGTTTLPVYIYGMTRTGATPELNAISTILIAFSLLFVIAAYFLGRRNDPAE